MAWSPSRPDLRAIWARMPEDARERIRRCPDHYRDQLTELWEVADRNDRDDRLRRDEEAQQERQEREADELDEAMVTKALDGEYGKPAHEVVSECIAQHNPHVASRRAFLRECRKAIRRVWDGRRHGGSAGFTKRFGERGAA